MTQSLIEKIEAAIVAYHEKTTEQGEFWRPCEFRHGMEVAEEIAIDIIRQHQAKTLELVEITEQEAIDLCSDVTCSNGPYGMTRNGIMYELSYEFVDEEWWHMIGEGRVINPIRFYSFPTEAKEEK